MLDQTAIAERSAQKAHHLMRQTGHPPEGVLPAIIESSWRRCLATGPKIESKPEFDPGRRDALDLMRQRNKALVDHALPIMETLYEQIANTQSMVVLSDATGYILHSLGDDDFLAKAQRVALSPGVEWSEYSRGTNAIGTALAEKNPVVVHAAQHFLPANHFLTCSAAPLHDPYGRVVGVLDVTGDHRRFSPHTLALANMSARMIENHLFCHAFPDACVVRLHARPEFLGTLCEGLAAFREDGLLISANHSGCFQFGLPENQLQHQTFDALFGLRLSAAIDLASRSAPAPCPLLLHNGIRVFVRIEAAQRRSPPSPVPVGPVPLGEAPAKETRLQALLPLVEQAVSSRNPLLIEYEDKAVGPDVQSCLRQYLARDAVWVELDCGNPSAGQFEAILDRLAGRSSANDGGAMEIAYLGDVHKLDQVQQARLVSSLQQALRPHCQELPLALIASSCGKLKKHMARGNFRADLYYRLSGQVVALNGREPRCSPSSDDLDSITRQAIEAALEAAGGNVSAASRRLGISRSTLYRHLRER
jgi:transcriptional regulator of acetoin/glycerol metabolism